uniref:Uncharacterized protein n=1 Tax=Cryptomonas curvata TaxID=233186 RepID=A0A7S0QDN1_9CRYP
MRLCFGYNGTTDVPYIAGQWEMTYEFTEMYGSYAGYDGIQSNPCRGPFPYQYKWLVYIWQEVDKKTKKTTGNLKVCWSDWMDCQYQSRDFQIVKSSKEETTVRCPFRPYDETEQYYSSGRLPPPGYAAYKKPATRLSSSGAQIAPPAVLWSKFAVPADDSGSFVWGSLCAQFSWADQAGKIGRLPTAHYYRGSIRYENETWVVLRAINTCPCFPACAECEESIPGTNLKQVANDGGACLARFGVVPQQCKFTIAGVSGGPVRYPKETVDLHNNPPSPAGREQVCFTFSRISGRRLFGPEALPIIKLTTWLNDIGDPALNPDPG